MFFNLRAGRPRPCYFFCARFYCLFLSFHLPVEGADRRVCPIYWRLVFAVWSQSPSRLRRICLWRSCLRSFSNHKQVCIALTYSQLYPLAKRESFLFAVFVRGYRVETSVCPCGLSPPALRATSSYQSGRVFCLRCLFAVIGRTHRSAPTLCAVITLSEALVQNSFSLIREGGPLAVEEIDIARLYFNLQFFVLNSIYEIYSTQKPRLGSP